MIPRRMYMFSHLDDAGSAPRATPSRHNLNTQLEGSAGPRRVREHDVPPAQELAGANGSDEAGMRTSGEMRACAFRARGSAR